MPHAVCELISLPVAAGNENIGGKNGNVNGVSNDGSRNGNYNGAHSPEHVLVPSKIDQRDVLDSIAVSY